MFCIMTMLRQIANAAETSHKRLVSKGIQNPQTIKAVEPAIDSKATEVLEQKKKLIKLYSFPRSPEIHKFPGRVTQKFQSI